MDSARRVWWLKFGVVEGMLVGLLLSAKLWMNGRPYPLTPVWDGLKPLAYPFDAVVFAGWVLVLGAVLLNTRPAKWIAVFLAMAAVLVCFDQSRLQPWFYQYSILLAALGVCLRKGDAAARNACLNTGRLVVASIYFWSGLQKANPGFREDVFPWLMEPVLRLLPTALHAGILQAAPAVPLLEAGIGVGLLFRRTRSAAVVFALAMHALILLAIGPLGHNRNSVVWSWNLAMGFLLLLLFWRQSDFTRRDLLWPKSQALQRAVFVVVTLLPSLSFFGLWDNYLSWALYAGNKTDASLYVSGAVKERMPQRVRKYAEEDEDGHYEISLFDWSFGEMNVPPYPEARIYRSVAKSLCRYAARADDVTLVVESKSTWFRKGVEQTYGCASLGAANHTQ